jgi:hypothetical protein
LGINKKANNDVALGECGCLPLYVDNVTRFVKNCCKLLQMQNHKYPKNCYLMLKDLDDVGRHTWAFEVRETLFKFDFGFVWLSQDVGDITMFFS